MVLLIINPKGASGAIVSILKNYLYYPSSVAVMKYCGTTLVKASALLLCSLSVLFAYKVGLFNIGAAGQYVIGAGASLYFALKFGMPWYICLIVTVVLAALAGGLSGFLKAYFNVNEVISCIMLNWISLYGINMLLSQVKQSPHHIPLIFQVEIKVRSCRMPVLISFFRKQICDYWITNCSDYGSCCMGCS